DLDHAAQKVPSLDSKEAHLQEHQGFVRVAFRLAFWQLLHRASFPEALLDTINRGGDADTNGAITGALLGSFYGRKTMPVDWSETVLTCIPRRMNPDRTEYHPRTLMRFAMTLDQ
ncbi:MAG: ADP-ribosylglycohydrolase family protein, partial [Candidatus Dormibacteraceae bacterium]